MTLLLLIRFASEHIHRSIVLIDEVELNQHPLWQRRLLHMIPQMGTGNQIIATTHSPYLRDAVPPDAVIELGDIGDGTGAGQLVAVHLVCEGPRGSLDDRVLDALVVQHFGLRVLIAPAGGDRGLGAVRGYLESASRHNRQSPASDVAISVQDRNYLPFADANATWANPAGRSFTWRWHEIENYLLHPKVMLELFNEFRTTPNQPWTASLPSNEADVAALLQTLARDLVEEHAAEVLRDEVVRQLNGVGSVRFGPPRPTPTAGKQTPGQAEWQPALLAEANRLCQTCSAVAARPELQPAALTARYQTLLAQYQTPGFLASGNYLREMGGHELFTTFTRHLCSLGLSPTFDLAAEMLKMLARTYQPNTLFQPDDFAELAAILAQY